MPDHLVAEILGGELHTSPRPGVPHALATTGLGGDLIGAFDRGRGGPGGWWILVEPEWHLSDDVVVPDLAGWRRARVQDLPRAGFLEIAPDWVCETLSPFTEGFDRGKKLAIYAREGVAHVWLLNPIAETIEAYRLEHGRWLLLGTAKLVTCRRASSHSKPLPSSCGTSGSIRASLITCDVPLAPRASPRPFSLDSLDLSLCSSVGSESRA